MADDERTTPQDEKQVADQEETRSNSDSPFQVPDTVGQKMKGKERETSPEDSTLPDNDDKEGSEKSSNSNSTPTPDESSNTPEQQSWQAIFSPQYNAYYFYNAQTGETTWTNPLQPGDSGSASTEPVSGSASPTTDHHPNASSHYTALQQAALAQGIDPSLAHLDPSLAATTSGASGVPLTFQAKFNARTGAFARPDARTPGHLSEYERMKRMSEFYFDVNAWEQQVAQENAEEQEGSGKKRKRPSKKDLERFKEQKRLKKIAKTAWLRT